jgi:hypothetical protein
MREEIIIDQTLTGPVPTDSAAWWSDRFPPNCDCPLRDLQITAQRKLRSFADGENCSPEGLHQEHTHAFVPTFSSG